MNVILFVLEFVRVLLIVIVGSALLIGLEIWVYSIVGKDILANAWDEIFKKTILPI